MGRRDPVSRMESTIDINHAKIHDGSFYTFEISKSSLANSGTYKAFFTTPANTYFHLKNLDGWMSSAKLLVDLHENMTATATGGKSVTVFNRNRNSSLTSGLTVKESSTVTVGSAARFSRTFFGGGGTTTPTRAGGWKTENEEWVLKPNIKYGIVCTNQSGNSATFQVKFNMYKGNA